MIEGGDLALLASVQAALAAIDVAGGEPAPAAERAVVGDDGAAIVLTSYLGRGAVAAVPLSTRNAVKLAGELITAVGSRLAAADRGDLG